MPERGYLCILYIRDMSSAAGCSSEHSSPDERREGEQINGRISDRMVGGWSDARRLPYTPNLKQAVTMALTVLPPSLSAKSIVGRTIVLSSKALGKKHTFSET